MQVIDSSALVRYFSKEVGWETVEQYVADSVTMTLAISEAGHSLLKKIHRQEIQQKIASEILFKYARRALLLHDEEYIVTAFQTATSNNISFYDSMFIAACMEEGMELVTCDEKQAKVARDLGLAVILC